MLKNYFKTAFRNLARNKGYTSINIFGLAIGIAACLLIFLVIRFETSFDNFHAKKDQLYRVASKFKTQDGVDYSAGISFPVGPALRIDFPQLKGVASIFKSGDDQITVESDSKIQKKFQEDVYYAEPEFFSMFDFKWLSGNAKAALTQPSSAALTQEMAEKLFGSWHSAIGKTIKYNNDDKEIYKINGILKNPPANTDFPLGIVVSYSTLKASRIKQQIDDWVSTFGGAYTFVELPDKYSLDKFNAELPAFAKKHKPAEYAKDSYIAQPLPDMHSDDRFGNFRSHIFSESLVTALTLIGIFLIIIACVNFINLATAQAVNRSKEVGVRKVLGSNRKQLALQFLGETTLITIAAICVALVIAYAALPFLNNLLEVHMTINFIDTPVLIVFILALFILVTFLSGSYPAFVLSRFNPITALKSKISTSSVGGISIRRGLVVLQFIIAHILIIGTIIVVSQMNYFRNASLGFDKEAIITLPSPGDSISQTHIDYLRTKLLQNPGIKNVSFSYSSPSADGNWNSDFKFDHADKNTNFSGNLKWADVDYFKTYNIQFVAGRPYYPSDTVKEFVVNETLLKKLGINDPKKAIGKQIDFWDGKMVGPVVGVVKDFNAYSLREPMAPVVLSTWKKTYQTINIKVKQGEEKPVLAMLEKEWNTAFPDYVYEYKFLDETIDNFYKQESQLSQLYKIFAAIAIFISCLGLYGLVSFMVVQRTKEVGIRKVLGANVVNIVYLLSKEFTLLILIAFAIAGPIAYYIMNDWLQDYTYRIQLGVTVFLIAIITSMIIAWITVGHRAIKAALANPVKSLRTE
ncbi:MAG TPA: ABC transporter permease [Chitinophagaceae bacterium]|nr:ABC transporter permease [Chitinophagaceae bacterium]